MNSLKTLFAAAIAVGGFASAAHAQFIAAPNLSGTPNDGMACRSGYTPNFNGTSLKCSKTAEIKVDLACQNPVFPNKVVRADAQGTPNGLDVCDKPGGVAITSTNNISTFAQGSDYVFAKQDDARIASRTANQNQAEATALGLQVNEVETIAGVAVTDTSSGDSTDKSKVPLTFFTFPVKVGGLIGGPVVTAPTAFVPRPLSR